MGCEGKAQEEGEWRKASGNFYLDACNPNIAGYLKAILIYVRCGFYKTKTNLQHGWCGLMD